MLPYYKCEKIKQFYGVPHTLEYRNGYRVASAPKQEFGCARVTELNKPKYDSTWMYGRVKSKLIPPFRPDFVKKDGIILTFDGYFRQKVVEPNCEQYDLIRKIKLMYFMEDDTVTIVEPPFLNSGYPQGRIIRRSRIMKDPHRNLHLSWKDLNIDIELKIFGIVFHLTDCDPFTKEFLKANGIELNDISTIESKPTMQRPVTAPVQRTAWFQAPKIKPKPNLTLSFEATRIEAKKQLHDCVPYYITYYLEDDTISVKERKQRDESYDFCPFLIKRVKVPKYAKRLINSLIVAEDDGIADSNNEQQEFVQPSDFAVGKEVNLLGHRFLVRDCDAKTRKYYEEVLKMNQGDRINVDQIRPCKVQEPTPKYIGFGTPEDSLASCKSLVPREPRKNLIRYIVNANKYLRFGCVLDSARPEDQDRQFILKYSLADGKISIHELSITNSGIQGGKYLSPQLIAKNDCYTSEPVYYTCKDLYIGGILLVNCRRFIITSADLDDYRYMQQHPELFSKEGIESVREYLISVNCLSPTEEEKQ